MKKKIIIAMLAVLLVNAANTAYAATGKVIVSIKPLHSLVAAIMEGDDNAPTLLVDGKSSPHDFTLRPSQVAAISKADIVFYMGDSFEEFLDKALDAAPAAVKRVPMEKISGLTLYPVRVGNGFEPHVHEHPEGEEHHHHEEGAYDLHLWMSIPNSKAMVAEIVKDLSALYPAKAALYRDNSRKLLDRMDMLNQSLEQEMAPLRGKPFVVFHDAYQYFQKPYGLYEVGSITINPSRAPGAKHLSEIREKIAATKAKCVFREPEFDSKVVENLLEGSNAKSGVLDPEGALLTPGPELYFDLMNGLAKGLESCLMQ